MSEPILDLPEFQERVQNDNDLLLELLEIFIEDYQAKRGLIAEAINNNNADELRSLAHSLKGASGNISAKVIRNTFVKLEEAGAEKNLDGMDATLASLDEEFGDLQKRIEEIKKELVA